MRSYARLERRSVEIDRALGLLEPSPAFLPHPARTPWCDSSTGKQRPPCAFPVSSPRAGPRSPRRPPQVPSVRAGVRGPALPPEPGRPRAGRARPRHDRPGAWGLRRRRLLRGLCRCEGAAGGVQGALCGGRPGPCAAFCTRAEGSRNARVRRVQNRAENAGHAMMGRGKKFNTQPGCVPEGVTAGISGGWWC